MENFDPIFRLFVEHEGIGLNTDTTDILEAGVVNIIILIAILVDRARSLLGPSLKERKTKIEEDVTNAEDRLNEAKKRLTEAKKQSDQISLVIVEILKETHSTQEMLIEFYASQARKDLAIRFERGLDAFRLNERQIFSETKQQIISIVLRRTVNRVKETFKSKECATKFINDTINKLN
jgi:F-type H+-transporting ATPase subunit b